MRSSAGGGGTSRGALRGVARRHESLVRAIDDHHELPRRSGDVVECMGKDKQRKRVQIRRLGPCSTYRGCQ